MNIKIKINNQEICIEDYPIKEYFTFPIKEIERIIDKLNKNG